ncbi:DUF7281 domain-containing protein [Echinimonas agarilytica]|uniref:DUF7281 domain-containing protein n=1 Tax=Echinimonas agarilytica TaxID=1215918 RepID=A0AA41W616_9GAMM|nr:hypothetical protein [Echinimonas agarilytica]MCM2679590.1 hypothetical protein [Echinimonas agarilytica]
MKAPLADLTRFFNSPNRRIKVGTRLYQWLEQQDYLGGHEGLHQIELTHLQKQALKSQIEAALNLSFAEVEQFQTRSDFGRTRIHKSAPIQPEQHYVIVKSVSRPLLEFGHGRTLPQGQSLRVDVTTLNKGELKAVVVVENLDSFDEFHRFNLPAVVHHALIVFRGYNNESKGTKALLCAVSEHVPVIAAYDLDPAGLCMAQQNRCISHVLMPSVGNSQTLTSDLEEFKKQSAQAQKLSQLNFGKAQPLAENVYQNKLAIMQQGMLASGVPLEVFELN